MKSRPDKKATDENTDIEQHVGELQKTHPWIMWDFE
jgi:hypothetical protein